jgi:hypothetical protein
LLQAVVAEELVELLLFERDRFVVGGAEDGCELGAEILLV